MYEYEIVIHSQNLLLILLIRMSKICFFVCDLILINHVSCCTICSCWSGVWCDEWHLLLYQRPGWLQGTRHCWYPWRPAWLSSHIRSVKHCPTIDHMHMTSQKGAPVRWGSNEALPRALSPSMQPEGQPLHAIPPGWPGPAHWLRGWVIGLSQWLSHRAERQCALPAQHVRAARQVLTPNMASLLWRRDVNA